MLKGLPFFPMRVFCTLASPLILEQGGGEHSTFFTGLCRILSLSSTLFLLLSPSLSPLIPSLSQQRRRPLFLLFPGSSSFSLSFLPSEDPLDNCCSEGQREREERRRCGFNGGGRGSRRRRQRRRRRLRPRWPRRPRSVGRSLGGDDDDASGEEKERMEEGIATQKIRREERERDTTCAAHTPIEDNLHVPLGREGVVYWTCVYYVRGKFPSRALSKKKTCSRCEHVLSILPMRLFSLLPLAIPRVKVIGRMVPKGGI